MALSLEHLDFGSGHDAGVVGLSHALGSVLSVEAAWDSLSLSLSPSAPLPPFMCTHALLLTPKLKRKRSVVEVQYSIRFLLGGDLHYFVSCFSFG